MVIPLKFETAHGYRDLTTSLMETSEGTYRKMAMSQSWMFSGLHGPSTSGLHY